MQCAAIRAVLRRLKVDVGAETARGALLRSLFSNCRAIGLCLYHRHRMPLKVIDGALATHPILCADGDYLTNPLYDPEVSGV